jgi:azurin
VDGSNAILFACRRNAVGTGVLRKSFGMRKATEVHSYACVVGMLDVEQTDGAAMVLTARSRHRTLHSRNMDMRLLAIVGLLVFSTSLSMAGAGQEKKSAGADQEKKAAGAKSGAARTIEITAGDDMKFGVTQIDAKPGEQLRVVLKSVGKMPKAVMGHNFVVLKAGADPAAFNNAAMNARATDFMPPELKSQVHAATPGLLGPGETLEVTFKAPAKPGEYTFLCSFPGHFAAGMKGILAVK